MIKFGINSTDLYSAAAAIGAELGVVLQLRDSEFRGGEYFRADIGRGAIFLQSNQDLLDDEPFEANWPIDQLILILDGLDTNVRDSYAEQLRHLTAPTATELEQRPGSLS
jgi:hypothetical protein